jgi:hypothetical protein
MVEIASQTAVSYSTGLFAVPVRWVLIRDPEQILSWFMMCWQLEVTFQEMRRHLGFETQRQWSDLAIRRTTPALLGMFSLVTLFAHHQMKQSSGRPPASRGLVSQSSSDIRRCACVGVKGVVGSGADFLWVAFKDRHDESHTGLCGATYRCDLLRGVNG